METQRHLKPALTSFIHSLLPPRSSVSIAPLSICPGAAAVCPESGMFGFRGNLARDKFHQTTQASSSVMSRLACLFLQQWQATVN